MSKFPRAILFAGLVSGLLLSLTACNPAGKDPGATATSQGGTTGSVGCGPAAFRQLVEPLLAQNCASCHNGAGAGPGFASLDLQQSYGIAKSLATFGAPAQSLLVTTSSNPAHCSTVCGSTWGQSLTQLITQWASAEAGNATVCAAYAADSSGLGGTTVFTLGPYTPPDPNNTIVVPEGLTEFSKAGGVHAMLAQNCLQCHVPGGQEALLPFAVSDPLSSYKVAKTLVYLGDVKDSQLLLQASLLNHGGGCTICGDSTFSASLGAAVTAWAGVETLAAANSAVSLASLPIPQGLTSSSDALMSWNLDSYGFTGAKFTLLVRLSSTGTTTYRFSNPTIITAGAAIQVQGIGFKLNGMIVPYQTTYSTVNTLVAAHQTAIVSSSAALMPSTDLTTDQLGIQFQTLKTP